MAKRDKIWFDTIYTKYNRREFVHPDPLEFLYNYNDPGDREIAGLIASSLAYGRVAQILKSVSSVLEKLSGRPSKHLMETTEDSIRKRFKGFKHRFTADNDISLLLIQIKKTIAEYGSLKECFMSGCNKKDESIIPAMTRFIKKLKGETDLKIMPEIEKGSACKRIHLFLRWMIRKDEVDPGGWDINLSSKLVVPLDTHMHKIAMRLGFTNRKAADLTTALEITKKFARISPSDPVKYDFSLTRFGIRDDLSISQLED